MDAPTHSEVWKSLKVAARNQILADLLTQLATPHPATTFTWNRIGWLEVDGHWQLTPEQMAALEDALLEHKAKAHDPNWHIPGPDPVEIPFDAQGILHLPPEEED